MYKAYVKEKENLITHESEVGFGAYRINKFGKFFEIGDFYIKPEHRNGRESTKLFNELVKIAKENGCTKITCCVETYTENPEASLFVILRHGFKFSHIRDEVIYFYKNIME